MNLQTRIEVQGATQQWVDSFMQQYNISAAMMEDALNKVLSNLKDKVVIELLVAANQARAAAMQEQQTPVPQENMEEGLPQEQEA